mmetsp:Transcript_11461/g.9884  ORF Transcript_11461/g.9884 Transcript_11461/m.9884 type:complete len:168 (+) Transcript_11461:304-807(+)
MHLMRSFEDINKVVGVQLMPGSLTSNSGRHPGFRIFTVDEETKLPIDYDQYRLNVTKWNDVHEGQIEWDLVYTFLDEYGLEDMSLESIDAMVDRLPKDQDLMNTYYFNIMTGSWDFNPPMNEGEKKKTYCEAKYGISSQTKECRSNKLITRDFSDPKLGQWYYFDKK